MKRMFIVCLEECASVGLFSLVVLSTLMTGHSNNDSGRVH